MDPVNLHKQTSFNVLDVYKNKTVDEIKEISRNASFPYAVALANLTGDLNVGNIVRTSCVFAAERLFIFGRRKYDRRSSVGGHHYLDLQAHYVDTNPFDWDSMLQTIRVNGYTPIIIEQYGKPLDEYHTDYHYGKPCLVFGSEDLGVPSEVCDKELCYKIPQRGVLRSLNVASAAAIAIHFISNVAAVNK